jgi:hypothetical protein
MCSEEGKDQMTYVLCQEVRYWFCQTTKGRCDAFLSSIHEDLVRLL